MATNDQTAMHDPAPEPQASGSPALATAAVPSAARLMYWSVTRELWENRYLYVAPAIVAAVFLFGFAIGVSHHLPLRAGRLAALPEKVLLVQGFAFVLMGTSLVIAMIYCLGALHNERHERSILFWKSLPVGDLTTVIAKAGIPLLVLPMITFIIIVVIQGIMLLFAGAGLLLQGGSVADLWSVPLLSMWAQTLYHLLAVHSLYYAPIYGWLLLVSGWARRATFLWAGLPIVAVMIVERLVFGTAVFAHMLLSRLAGGPTGAYIARPGHMAMRPLTPANIGAFLVSPGLWIGLVVFALLLAAAAWLRRRQGPI
jgi:ABC-2 type transport system permease protein